MTIRSQGKNAHQGKKKTMWDQAISEAEHRIKQLRFTIRVYKQNRDRGEPWPGEQVDAHTSEQQHSV